MTSTIRCHVCDSDKVILTDENVSKIFCGGCGLRLGSAKIRWLEKNKEMIS